MLSCKQVSRLISESHERKLSLMQRGQLRLHLSMCKRCRAFSHNTERLNLLMKRFAQQEIK